jgi:hypothetical protein
MLLASLNPASMRAFGQARLPVKVGGDVSQSASMRAFGQAMV